MKRIEILGGIASGKTTLAKILRTHEVVPIFEDFQANPFWADFYADPVAYAFETEVTFVLQHYHEVVRAKQNGVQACVTDYSSILDIAYADVTLSASKFEAFSRVHQEVRETLGYADLYVYLQCDPEIELERIRRRGRRQELAITSEYLEHLGQALARRVVDIEPTRVVTVDSGAYDYANDPHVAATVKDVILGAFENVK